MEIEKTNVLGVGISVIDQDRAREFLFDAVAKPESAATSPSPAFMASAKRRTIRN